MAAIERLALEEAAEIEHIQLGSDDETQPLAPAHGAISATLDSENALRGTRTRLEILDDRYLRVRIRNHRGLRRDYVVDLRFVDPRPLQSVTIAWRCVQTALACGIAFAATFPIARLVDPAASSAILAPARTLALTATVFAGLLALYRSRATVEFYSAHGRALLVRFDRGLRSGRRVGEFARTLSERTRDVLLERAQPRQHLLRDEMREHFRLREAGVLSASDYESSRSRILQAHG